MGRKQKHRTFLNSDYERSNQILTFDSDEEDQSQQTKPLIEPQRSQPSQTSRPSSSHQSSHERSHTPQNDQKKHKYSSPPPKKKPRLDSKAKLDAFRKQLPIFSARDILLKEIESNQSVIIIGETGSGKTTQIAQYIYEHYGGKSVSIAITQPRRLAATTTATRVAEEMGVEIGDLVGYNVRFDNKSSENTQIKFLTDGMLVRECMVDSNLSKYNYVILDEAHERSINTDMLCALVRQIQHRRPELKVIIMSATLEAALFEKYFQAKVLYVQGRQYPVDVYYTNVGQRQWIDSMITTIIQINLEERGPGDMLAFLPGKEDIENVANVLEEKAKLFPNEVYKLIVCPLFAAQSSEQQQEAFQTTPQGCRKVVLATNIAETSITVPNIKFVIDSGLVKLKCRSTREKLKTIENEHNQMSASQVPKHQQTSSQQKNLLKNPGGFIDVLAETVVSKAGAWQRAGRAGRTQPGKAYRLYTEQFFLHGLPESQVPEIKRVDLTNTLLQMMTIGIEDPINFPWIDPPDKSMLRQAFAALVLHKAVDKDKKITKMGKLMSKFPIEPRYSKVLIHSKNYECTNQVLTIIAMLTTENIFFTPSGTSRSSGHVGGDDEHSHGLAAMDAARKTFASNQGDHIFLLNVYHAYHREHPSNRKKWATSHLINWRSMESATSVRNQLEEYWRNAGLPLPEETPQSLSQLMDTSSTEWQDLCDRICKSFIMGFFEQVAIRRPDGSYETLKEQQPLKIHPASIMFNSKPECVIYNEMVFTTNFYMRDVLAIQRVWLDQLMPTFMANLKQPSPSDSNTSNAPVNSTSNPYVDAHNNIATSATHSTPQKAHTSANSTNSTPKLFHSPKSWNQSKIGI